MKNRLKIVRRARRYTQKETADIVGITQNAYSYWESGKVRVDADSLSKLAQEFRVPVDFLCGRDYVLSIPISEWRPDRIVDWQNADEEEKVWLEYLYGNPVFTTESYVTSGSYGTISSHPVMRQVAKKKIPILGNVACGEPIFAQEEYESFMDADADADVDFCLIAKGDSMINARIFDGDIVFVIKQDMVDNGEIAVVLIDDEATVKRVYYDRENGIVTLVPENPTHKPMRYTGEQLNHIRILGKVVSGQYKV